MNAIEAIRAELFSLRDEEYRCFQSKLMPEIAPETVIGVRMPTLRAYAKRLFSSGRTDEFLTSLPHAYYEENNLHMALLEQIRDPEEALDRLETFLPYLDNWATCDSFCPKILQKDPVRLLSRIRIWLTSPHPFTVRYGLVRLIPFLDPPRFTPEILGLVASVKRDEYYVRMAQAWFFSIALIKQSDAALPYLHAQKLSPWVHNKAIQKTRESLRSTPEYRCALSELRIPIPKESEKPT